jgi:hypothetical protein
MGDFGRVAQFSLTYGRMYPISPNAVCVMIQLKCSRSLTLSKYGTPSTVLEGFTAIALTSHFQQMTRYLRRSERSHALHSSGTALWYFQQLLRIKIIVRFAGTRQWSIARLQTSPCGAGFFHRRSRMYLDLRVRFCGGGKKLEVLFCVEEIAFIR